MDVDALSGDWTTGAGGRPPAGRTVVVEDDEAVESLIVGSPWTTAVRCFTGDRPTDLPAHLRTRSQTFTDSFQAAEAEVLFGNGFRLRQGHYGTADFLPMDMPPTVLRVSDDDDFSAFLRDADMALTTGWFARGVSVPTTLIADTCGLGAAAGAAGPDRRIYIGPSGTVRRAFRREQWGSHGK